MQNKHTKESHDVALQGTLKTEKVFYSIVSILALTSF